MTTSFMHRTRNALLAMFTLMLTSITCLYLYSFWFEESWLSYKEMPFVVTAPVMPGTLARALVVRCSTSKTSESYRTTHTLMSASKNVLPVILPSIEVTIEPGCHEGVSKANVVPDDTPPGFYSFGGVAKTDGLMVAHDVPWNTEVFEVLPKPAQVNSAPAPADITADPKP